MTTLPLAFTVQPRFQNYQVVRLAKLRDGAWSEGQSRGVFDVKRMSALGSSQFCIQGSLGTTRMNQAELQPKIVASAQSSTYQLGTDLYTRADIDELENVSTYLFWTDTGDQVKVYVGKKYMKYVVYIEASFSSEWMDENELVLLWGVYRSDSSSLMPLEPQSSTSDSTSSINQTPFTQKSLRTHALAMEFDSDDAPFYLSFLLQCSSEAAMRNIEMRSHRNTNLCVPVGMCSGYPSPLGISFCDDGSVNFALFSRNVDKVILCLYDKMADNPSLKLELDPYVNRTGDIWHVKMENITPYMSYGYQCLGVPTQDEGKSSHESHVLLDPYAKVLHRCFIDCPEPVSRLGKLIKEPNFDWSGEVRPCIPMEKLVVYRLNVERFTKDESSKLPADVAGTFSGLIEKVGHFKRLGVNAILLEPVFPFIDKKGPYFPYHFFSPMYQYGPTQDSLSAINSMKEMVKVLHANKIEVLLEVVFTRTADHGDSPIGLKGIDNKCYYFSDEHMDGDDRSAVKCNFPVVQRLILDSLRHWVMEFHIDGFCFMNASSLLRGSNGEYLSRPPLVEAIAFDPLLSKTKVIADSLDPYSLVSKEIRFPHWKRWAEMNTKFCSDVRNFLRGEGLLLSNLATRLCGSADVFLDGRGPAFAFNFVARNFGLPLVDLVSFSSGELLSELSWNCGQEGPTNKTVVLERRLKQIRNFIFILYISMGVPVLNMGDECGQSSGGSSSYSQRRSFHWDALNTGFGVQMTKFIAFLGALRTRRSDLLQRRNYVKVENVNWHGSDQAEPSWDDPLSKFLAMTLKAELDISEQDSKTSSLGSDLFIAFNASDCPETVILPPPSEGMCWFRLVDTSLPFPRFFLTDGEVVVEKTPGLLSYEMSSHTSVLFEARIPVD